MSETTSGAYEKHKWMLSDIQSGLSDLGALLLTTDPGSLTVGHADRNIGAYWRAIHLLEREFFPHEAVLYKSAGELSIHRFSKVAYDMHNRSRHGTVAPGTLLAYRPATYSGPQIFDEERFRTPSHLPRVVHYL